MDDSNVVRHIPSVTVLPQQPEWRIPPDNVHYVEYLYSCNNMVWALTSGIKVLNYSTTETAITKIINDLFLAAGYSGYHNKIPFTKSLTLHSPSLVSSYYLLLRSKIWVLF